MNKYFTQTNELGHNVLIITLVLAIMFCLVIENCMNRNVSVEGVFTKQRTQTNEIN